MSASFFRNAKIICTDANPAEYHEASRLPVRGHPQFPVTNSMLNVLAQNPRRWLHGYEPPASDAKDYGSLLDCLLLTPDQFEKRYAVPPSHYTRDGERKDWRNDLRIPEVKAWHEAHKGKEHVSGEDLAEARAAAKAFSADPVINAFHEASETQVWLEAEYVDPATARVVPVKALLDLAPWKESEFASCLGDLKTTRNASRFVWRRYAYQMGYHRQGALSLDLYNAATNEQRDTWCWLLQENYRPYETAKRMASPDFLAVGRLEYQSALALYCRCLQSGEWPGYDDHPEAVQGWSVVEPEDWMKDRANRDSLAGTDPDWLSGPAKEETAA